MRVMVCYYFFEHAITLGNDLAHGFESLGHEVCRFDSTITRRFNRWWKLIKSLGKLFGQKKLIVDYHEHKLSEGLSKRFCIAAETFRADLIVVIQGERIPATMVQDVSKRLGARSVLWWVKPPRWQASIFEDLPFYNLVLTIDGSASRDGVGHLPSWGLNSKLFYPGRLEEKIHELLFVGSWSEHRQRHLEAIADLPLRVVGGGWKKRLPISHPLRAKLAGAWIDGKDLADAYRLAWAVVDIPQFGQTEGEGVNMRFADVPACATVLITTMSEEVRRWFTGSKGVLIYGDPVGLREQCKLVLDGEIIPQAFECLRNQSLVMPTFADRARFIEEHVV